MFFGTFTPKLDEKGRLTLPAKFRDMTAGGVMVTRGQDRSLYVYLPSDFNDLADRLRAASRDSEAARAYRRTLFANTDEQRPDGQGRITINGEHRSYAGLSKECVVIGNDDRLEIWDAASWREYQDQHEDNFSKSGVEALEPGF